MYSVISVLANYVPKQLSKCIHNALHKKNEAALKVHYKLLEMMQLNFIDTNPIPVKAIMKELGMIKSATVRLPLLPMTDHNLAIIKAALIDIKKYL